MQIHNQKVKEKFVL